MNQLKVSFLQPWLNAAGEPRDQVLFEGAPLHLLEQVAVRTCTQAPEVYVFTGWAATDEKSYIVQVAWAEGVTRSAGVEALSGTANRLLLMETQTMRLAPEPRRLERFRLIPHGAPSRTKWIAAACAVVVMVLEYLWLIA